MLFPSLAASIAPSGRHVTSGRRVLGVDIADGGKDSTRGRRHGRRRAVGDDRDPRRPDSSTIDTAEQTALGIIKIAQQRNIKPQCR